MNIHVLGLGAVGTLVAHFLRSSLPRETHRITLIHRTATQSASALQQGGVLTAERNGVRSTSQGFLFEHSSTHSNDRPRNRNRQEEHEYEPQLPISSLFVATKAHNVVPAMRDLLPRLNPHCTIVLLNNGMGVYEKLVQEVFQNPLSRPKFVLGINTHGSYLREPMNVIHAGQGSLDYAVVPEEKHNIDLEASFSRGEPPFQGSIADIPHEKHPEFTSLYHTMAALNELHSGEAAANWVDMHTLQGNMMLKLVANAVINPLSALLNCRNGDLFRTDASKRILSRVCQESSAVFRAQFTQDTTARIESIARGASASDVQALWDDAARFPKFLEHGALEENTIRIAEATARNFSSMLVDVRRGRQTEVDFINGYLLGLGNRHRVPMPGTAMLLNLIKMRSEIPLSHL